jgi:hypothetical protein
MKYWKSFELKVQSPSRNIADESFITLLVSCYIEAEKGSFWAEIQSVQDSNYVELLPALLKAPNAKEWTRILYDALNVKIAAEIASW